MITADTTVPHDLAYQCLKSMPFESDRATIFLTNMRKILEFQSTVEFLKGGLFHQDSIFRIWLKYLDRSSIRLQDAIG